MFAVWDCLNSKVIGELKLPGKSGNKNVQLVLQLCCKTS